MILSIIVAAAENNAIGKDNQLLWDLPADMEYFRAKTKGHPVIVGRKTFQSIGKPLPGRTNVVLSHIPDETFPGCTMAHALDEALQIASQSPGSEEVFVIGGAYLYKEMLPRADRLYLTRVHATLDGDVFFPAVDPLQWEEVSRVVHPVDATHRYPLTFFVYERKK